MPRDLRVSRVRSAFRVRLDLKERLAFKALRASKGPKVFRASPARRALMALRVRRVSRAWPDRRACRVSTVLRVQVALRA
ncbi:hypothetical protein ACF09J_17040 [Streptomyces sp. NPDC014889]|uniref:hypothetical protein n=1 Tax=Streptomyces sp. NPDC014889 TaxID=3364928 RepID=UPI0036FB6504